MTVDTGVATRSYLFVLGSARAGGSTESLARYAASHLPAEVAQQWVSLRDVDLGQVTDTRDSGDPMGSGPAGGERLLLEATLDASDLVIVSPLYWYSVSAPVKLYFDHWSEWMRLPGVGFRERMSGKRMWAVSTLGRGELDDAQPLVEMLRRSARYLDMGWGGALVGSAQRSTDPASAEETAHPRADRFFTG